MKITEVRTYRLACELAEPFAFSQWTYTRRETMLVSVRTDDGITGWGEAYGPTALTESAVRDFLAPLVIGRDPRDTEALWRFLFTRGIDYGPKGVLVAGISALDIAFWDIKARTAGQPLYRALGGEPVEAIPCYATGFYFGGEQPLERKFQREAERHLATGFRAMKMKAGLGVEPDTRLVRAVRKAIGEDTLLMVDANHAYSPVEAVALGHRIAECDITWFEEPVSPLDIEGYREVKRSIPIPLAGGECEYTRFGFEPLLRARAIDYAQPDLCACGGISEGMKIATIASIHQVHVTPHAWGSAIGQAAALHFYAARPSHPGTLTAERKLIECDQTENPLRTAIVKNPVRLQDGQWWLPETPGLGLEIDMKEVERHLR